MQESAVAPRIKLVVDRLEIALVLLLRRPAAQHQEPTLLVAGGYEPGVVTYYYYVKQVGRRLGVHALGLDRDRAPGDQRLERALVSPVTREEGLITDEHALVPQVRVKVLRDARLVTHHHSVLSPEVRETLREHVLAYSLQALDHDRDVPLLVGTSNRMRHPPDEVTILHLVSLADVVPRVRQVPVTGPLDRRVGEAPPQVVDALRRLMVWLKHHLLVLAAVAMLQPHAGPVLKLRLTARFLPDLN